MWGCPMSERLTPDEMWSVIRGVNEGRVKVAGGWTCFNSRHGSGRELPVAQIMRSGREWQAFVWEENAAPVMRDLSDAKAWCDARLRERGWLLATQEDVYDAG